MQFKHIITIVIVLGALLLGASNESVQDALNFGAAVQDVELRCKTASSSDFSVAANTSMLVAATNTQENRLWVRISASSTPNPIWANHFYGLPAVHGLGLPVFPTTTEYISDYYGQVYVISQAAATFSVTECFF